VFGNESLNQMCRMGECRSEESRVGK
jgi:hypothetical protein